MKYIRKMIKRTMRIGYRVMYRGLDDIRRRVEDEECNGRNADEEHRTNQSTRDMYEPMVIVQSGKGSNRVLKTVYTLMYPEDPLMIDLTQEKSRVIASFIYKISSNPKQWASMVCLSIPNWPHSPNHPSSDTHSIDALRSMCAFHRYHYNIISDNMNN